MSCVFSWTYKSSIHMALDAQLLLDWFWVPFNQGEVSACFINVNLITLQMFGKVKDIYFYFYFNSNQVTGGLGNEAYLNHVNFVSV